MSEENESAGFKWTGHPFIDFGVATLMEWCGLSAAEDTPEQMTIEQLLDFTEEGKEAYFTKPDLFKSVMLCFGSNFLNPSWSKEQQMVNVLRYLQGFHNVPNPDLPECTFFKHPSVDVVSRDAFPLIMGRGPINFYPGGQPGIAVSGQVLTAIQALMFGALRSQGKLLVLETDDRNLLRAVVHEWVGVVQKRIQLSRLSQELEDIAPPKSALVGTLERLERARISERRAGESRYNGGATLYHFSNSGQGPSIDVYPLGAPILAFITQAQAVQYYPAWIEIRQRGWPRPKVSKKAAPLPQEYEPGTEQQRSLSNRFYNDMFSLPENAIKFVHNYFFVTVRSLVEGSVNWNESRRLYGNEQIRALWDLTELFMEEVLAVKNERVADIKQLSIRLAEIAMGNPPLYKKILQVRRNWPEVRRLLRQISRRETEQGRGPVVTLDQFLSIFEMGEDTEYVDWGLAWDLVLIKLMEELYKLEFFSKHPEFATTEADETEADELVAVKD